MHNGQWVIARKQLALDPMSPYEYWSFSLTGLQVWSPHITDAIQFKDEISAEKVILGFQLNGIPFYDNL